MSASHFKLDNLTAVIDNNHLQYDGETEEIMSLSSLEEKWRAFGWDVYQADGHSVEELFTVLRAESSRPKAVIADTVKGKGVSFMENDPAWHNASLSLENYEKAIQEQEEAYHELLTS